MPTISRWDPTKGVDVPLRWRKIRHVQVVADLFHPRVPEEFIARVWTVMAKTPQHTYQILTKRHDRMRSIVRRIAWRTATTEERQRGVRGSVAYVQPNEKLNDYLGPPRVLPNVWLGVSAEDQKRANLRIPALLDTPAAIRWISAEPLLGPVDLSRWLGERVASQAVAEIAVAHGVKSDEYHRRLSRYFEDRARPSLDWVVAGGESGPGSRPAHPDWFRRLRDQCVSAGVAFHFKQHGDWVPESMWLHRNTAPAAFLSTSGTTRLLVNGKPTAAPMSRGEDITIRRVGKKAAGRELDGRIWDQYPTTTLAGAR